MTVEVAYRHSKFTAAPDGLSAAEIWAVARKVRNQLVDDRFERRLLLDRAAERLSRFEANGIAFDVDGTSTTKC